MRIFYLILSFSLLFGKNFSQSINPFKYIATLRFDNNYLDFLVLKKEQVFPVSFLFNTKQDGNRSGTVDVEDACENIVQYAIGDSIYGTGRTGLAGRGPNDQRPAIYFHFVKCAGYDVYEYWLYYADNDYMNNHEHDWEKYFVYEKRGVPEFVKLGWHHSFFKYTWEEFRKDDGHIILGVGGGSHALSKRNKKGVQIRYNGAVSKNKGRLDVGNGSILPWRIYTNDTDINGAIHYVQSPDCFFNGDPVYPNQGNLSSSKENGKCSKAPWLRKEWDDPLQNCH